MPPADAVDPISTHVLPDAAVPITESSSPSGAGAATGNCILSSVDPCDGEAIVDDDSVNHDIPPSSINRNALALRLITSLEVLSCTMS